MNLALKLDPRFDYRAEVLCNQRTEAGLAYERFLRGYAALRTNDPAMRAALGAANKGLVQLRDLGPDAVHINALMSEMSIRFTNDEYIGDRLMPFVTVGKKSNNYAVYDERASMNFPDDALGPRGQANEVSQAINMDNMYNCKGRGLEETVDLTEIDNADEPLDPLMDANLLVNEGVAFNRELRYAAILTDTANFGANVHLIAAGDEWNSPGGGNPVALIQSAVSSVFRGRGTTKVIGYTSVGGYNVLSRHPQILDVFKYSKTGFVPPKELANFFGLDDLLIGRGWKDTANIGQTAVTSRIWGNVFGVVVVQNMPTRRSYHFGSSFRFGAVESVQLFDRRPGVRGMYTVKVAHMEDYKAVAPKAGYLITNVLDSALL